MQGQITPNNSQMNTMRQQANQSAVVTSVSTKISWIEWTIIGFLFVAFIFSSLFDSLLSYSGTYITIKDFWVFLLINVAISYLIFELAMRLYFFFVSLSIYVFVIPKRMAYYSFRVAYACKTICVTGISFLMMLFPLSLVYLAVVNLILNFAMFFLYFWYIKKKYLNELLAPFAFKALMRPFLVYQLLIMIISVGGVFI